MNGRYERGTSLRSLKGARSPIRVRCTVPHSGTAALLMAARKRVNQQQSFLQHAFPEAIDADRPFIYSAFENMKVLSALATRGAIIVFAN